MFKINYRDPKGPAQTEQRARLSGLSRFGRDHSGNIGMLFGFMILPIVIALGIGTDFGRAQLVRTQMQIAADAAVLAGGREWQVSADEVSAESVAEQHFEAMTAELGVDIEGEATLDTNNNRMSFETSASVETTFMKVANKDFVDVSASSSAELAQGGVDVDLEVALMLDVTGSMSELTSEGDEKIEAMKLAAADLVNILVREDQSEHTSKVALVPFSSTVNLGAKIVDVTGQSLTRVIPQTCTRTIEEEVCTEVCKKWKNGVCTKWKTECETVEQEEEYDCSYTEYLYRCITDRTGAEAFTDGTPTDGFATNYGDAISWSRPAAYRYSTNQWNAENCSPQHTVIPLTSDKEVLTDAIEAFTASGYTAGQLGTAWAWYTLSPNFGDIWGGDSRPANYGAAMKVAILMTDGEYNTYYEGDNGNSATQARALCDNMKAAGITVYTIGFMLPNQTAIDTMSQCASSEDKAFLAEDSTEIQEVFRSIGFELAQLRLTQ